MELRECPFCDGEAVRELDSGEPIIRFHHDDGCFLADEQTMYDCPSAEKAWNRRAERTCRDTDHDTESITCSECGEITRETLFWVDVGGGKTVKGHRPRFCSSCGARVVSE